MTSPIEFRHYLRHFTLQDLAQGINPLRLPVAQPNGQLAQGIYAPPILQWRYKEKSSDGGLQWSAWHDVPMVKEGDEPFHVGDLHADEQTVRQ